MYDLATLDTRIAADSGVWVDMIDIAGNLVKDADGQPMRFKIAGRDSAVGKEVMGKLRPNTDDAEIGVGPLILGWSEGFTFNGEPFPYSAENADKVAAIPFIASFVVAKAFDRANFTKKPSPN